MYHKVVNFVDQSGPAGFSIGNFIGDKFESIQILPFLLQLAYYHPMICVASPQVKIVATSTPKKVRDIMDDLKEDLGIEHGRGPPRGRGPPGGRGGGGRGRDRDDD